MTGHTLIICCEVIQGLSIARAEITERKGEAERVNGAGVMVGGGGGGGEYVCM